MLFTTTALASNIITQQEADSLETWIDANIYDDTVMQVPSHLMPIFNKVALFRAQGTLQ